MGRSPVWSRLWCWYRRRRVGERIPRILVFGDSNSARSRPGRAAAWPAILGRRLMGCAEVVNVSCDGRTTGWDEGSLNARHCFAATLDTHAPLDAVVIVLGTNDFKSQYGVPNAEAVLQQLKLLMAEAGSKGFDASRFVLASPPPMGASARGELAGAAVKIAHLAELIEGHCTRMGLTHLNLHKSVSVRRHLGEDQVHLNACGRKRAAKLAYAALKLKRIW